MEKLIQEIKILANRISILEENDRKRNEEMGKIDNDVKELYKIFDIYQYEE